MPDLVGQYLGRYHLTERLGEGGMATVYRGYDTRLERDVAVKLIRHGAFPPETLDEVLRRFDREAKALAKLSHPNIVKVYDYGEHEGSPYLVMEYLPGGTLKKIIGKPLPWQGALRVLLPVARAVSYAHQQGILHRDIKPANILITDHGEPMLSDFGIAKLFATEQATALTGLGMAVGTPAYMAPEQWSGTTSPQSDQYSLGVVLYEMLTGRPPYVADTPAAIVIKQATEPLPSPREWAADLPESLVHVLIKVLAREPGDRYPDMKDLINALGNIPVGAPIALSSEQPRAEETLKVPVQKVEAAARAMSEKAEREPAENARRGRALRRAAWISGIIALVVLLVVAGSVTLAMFTSGAPSATQTLVGQTTPPSSPVPATNTPRPTQAPTQTITPAPTTPPAEISDAFGVSMRLVPAGTFSMGGDDGGLDEQPVHEVYLDHFYMDQYEVTNTLYRACVDAGACDPPQDVSSSTRPSYYGEVEFDAYPVVYVNWLQAKAYCEWRGAGLPTEAQWEKAAHGTDGRTYPWGEGIDATLANYNRNLGDTTPVGSYESGKSPFGLYDMTGNAWEWVADWYAETYYQSSPASNPPGPDAGSSRVVRGGGPFSNDYDVRAANRGLNSPDFVAGSLGFRCSRSP